MYNYRARFYDPLTGSFTQPDSLVPDPLDPRAWNRFGYVYGNPANFTDPSGHVPWALIGVAVLGGALNVTANALTRDNYSLLSTRALGDFTIGAGFGIAAYGTGAFLTSAGIAGALGVEGVWATRIAYTSRVLALGGLNALESFITARSYGESFGWNDARFAFGIGIAGGIVGEYIGSISSGAVDELKAAYKLDNKVYAGRRVMQAKERLRVFERSIIPEWRLARTIHNGKKYYPKYLVNRLNRQRTLLLADIQRVGQQALPYPSSWENSLRTIGFLGVAI